MTDAEDAGWRAASKRLHEDGDDEPYANDLPPLFTGDSPWYYSGKHDDCPTTTAHVHEGRYVGGGSA